MLHDMKVGDPVTARSATLGQMVGVVTEVLDDRFVKVEWSGVEEAQQEYFADLTVAHEGD